MSQGFRYEPTTAQHRRVVRRSRLTQLLNGRFAHRVTTIVGAAGYGKTTALALAVDSNRLDPLGRDVWITVINDSGPDEFIAGIARVLDAEPGADADASIGTRDGCDLVRRPGRHRDHRRRRPRTGRRLACRARGSAPADAGERAPRPGESAPSRPAAGPAPRTRATVGDRRDPPGTRRRRTRVAPGPPGTRWRGGRHVPAPTRGDGRSPVDRRRRRRRGVRLGGSTGFTRCRSAHPAPALFGAGTTRR